MKITVHATPQTAQLFVAGEWFADLVYMEGDPNVVSLYRKIGKKAAQRVRKRIRAELRQGATNFTFDVHA